MTHWIELRGAHNVSLERNVGYKSIGHGYVLGEGTEVDNVLSGNIGIFARRPWKTINRIPQSPGVLANLTDKDLLLQDAGDAIHPSVFFIANGYNTFEHNMAPAPAPAGMLLDYTSEKRWILWNSVTQMIRLTPEFKIFPGFRHP